MAAGRHRFPDKIEAKNVKGGDKTQVLRSVFSLQSRCVGCAGLFAIVGSAKKLFLACRR